MSPSKAARVARRKGKTERKRIRRHREEGA